MIARTELPRPAENVTDPSVPASALAVTRRRSSTTCGNAAATPDRKNRLMPMIPNASSRNAGPRDSLQDPPRDSPGAEPGGGEPAGD